MTNEGIGIYRCYICKKVYTEYRVKTGRGCPRCKSLKVSPTSPSFYHYVTLLPEIILYSYNFSEERTWKWLRRVSQ